MKPVIKSARPFVGPGKYLTGFDLDKLAAGATEYFEHIGSDTIQRVNAEFATRRRQFKKAKLRWRVSRGARRSLGWVPFKAAQVKRKGRCVRFAGKTLRVFEAQRLEGVVCKSGCFAQDAVGDWWLSVAVEVPVERSVAAKAAVGIDLGLKTTAATSDGQRLEAGRVYPTHQPQKLPAQLRRPPPPPQRPAPNAPR